MQEGLKRLPKGGLDQTLPWAVGRQHSPKLSVKGLQANDLGPLRVPFLPCVAIMVI